MTKRIHKKTVELPKKTIDHWNGLLLRDDIDYENEDLKKYETAFCKTVEFDDGIQMDIKVCTDTPEDHTIWSEAVLFDPNGCEIFHSDVDDRLDGEWELYLYDDETDTTHVYIAKILAV